MAYRPKQILDSDEQVIINDLLSFMFCKSKEMPKKELLCSVEDFYSEESISEAHNVLFSISTLKKPRCYGQYDLTNFNNLVAIYECFLNTPSDDLPVIVCKDLNNVPSDQCDTNDFNMESSQSNLNDIDVIDSDCSPTIRSEKDDTFFKNDNYTSDEEATNWQRSICRLGLGSKDISIYKKEQFQMRCQISEMVAIISELKEGLKDFSNNFESPPLYLPKYKSRPTVKNLETCDAPTSDKSRSKTKLYRQAIKIESNDPVIVKPYQLSTRPMPIIKSVETSENVGSIEGDSSSGVALLQKFIDEDDEKNIELFEDIDEKENLSNIEISCDEYDLNLDVSIKEGGELGNPVIRSLRAFKTERFSDNDNETDNYEVNLDIFGKDDEIHRPLNRNSKTKKKKRVTNIFKHPKVVVPTKCDNKVILIQEEDKGSEPTIISNCNFSLEADNSMDISSCSDSVKQLEFFTGVSDENISSNIISTEGNTLYSKNQMGLTQLQYQFPDETLNNVNDLKHPYSFDCILCFRNFRSSLEFNTHFVNCLNEKKQTENLEDNFCSQCGSFYVHPMTLKKHMVYHSQKRKFSCSFCSLRFIKMENFDSHIRKKHNPLNTFFCQFCPQSFSSKRYMMGHVRNHTGEKPYKCGLCGFKSATSNHLQEHLQAHGSSKKMICKICNFSCIGFSKLTKHMQYAHTTPLVCPRADCGKSYSHYFQYKRHRVSHLDEAKFKCSLCLYTTSVKSSKVKHVKTHANASYQCPECFVNLASKHNVSRHLKNYCKKNIPLMET